MVLLLGKLIKRQRSVIQRAGQTKTIFHQRFFARAVAGVHTAHLRHRNVRLVDHHQKILGHIVEQGVRRGSGRTIGENTRIVFNTAAHTDLREQFQIVQRAFADALGFYQLAVVFEPLHAIPHFFFDFAQSTLFFLVGGGVVGVRVNHNVVQVADALARYGLYLADAVDLVAEQLNAHGDLVAPGRNQLDGIAAHAEGTAGEADVVAHILDVDETGNQVVATDLHPRAQRDDQRGVVFGVTEAVNTRNAGHDDDVLAFKQRAGGRVAQTVDFVVTGGVFFNVHILLRQVGFRAVIVEVRYEIFHCVMGEKFAEFGIKLGYERFVVR